MPKRYDLGAVRVILNGEPRETAPAPTLARLLEDLGIDRRRVAVAVNAVVIPGTELDRTTPREGDRIEVIEAVGGG